MDPRPRRTVVARIAVSTLVAVAALAVIACGPDAGASVIPSSGPATSAPATEPTPALSSGPAEPEISSAPPPSQTDTEWGRIWDALPADFPRYPGGATADDATPGPVSAAYLVPGADAATIADWMQTTLETATYSTEALSGPLEDGSYVLDSVGEADCRIETRIVPLDEMTLVTVLYGAACPA